MINIHGGYWQAIYNLTHAGHLCADLAAHGTASWNVEYRRLGDPGGEWPGPLDDVVRAVDHVQELAAEYPSTSSGSSSWATRRAATWRLLAARKTTSPLRGVVSLAGVVDLHEIDRIGDDHGLVRRLLGAGPDEAPDRWREASPRALLPLGFRYVLGCGTEDVHWGPNRATPPTRSRPATTSSCSGSMAPGTSSPSTPKRRSGRSYARGSRSSVAAQPRAGLMTKRSDDGTSSLEPG